MYVKTPFFNLRITVISNQRQPGPPLFKLLSLYLDYFHFSLVEILFSASHLLGTLI